MGRTATCRRSRRTAARTSLGLPLIEAMHLGIPVVALDYLVDVVRTFLHDPALAARTGRRGREAALRRHGLARFLDDSDRLFKEVTP